MHLALVAACLIPLRASAQTTQVVYADALQNGWQNWSWATVNLAATSPVQAGNRSVSVQAANWAALYLESTTAIDPAVFTGLTFWVHGGAAGGQVVQVQGTIDSVGQTPVTLAPMPANAWRQHAIPLAALGFSNGAPLEGVWFQITTGASVPEFFIDSIAFTGSAPATNSPPSSGVVIAIDAAADRKPINPLIYGVNFAGSNDLRAMNVPLNRRGGNNTSRYNWKTNASNHALDWYFQSLEQEGGAGAGAAADLFIRESVDGGAEPMMTIPINGWVAKLGPGRQRLSSYSIAKYGAQTGNDWQWFPDAGNGILAASGHVITNNNPNDANMPVTPAFQAEWIQHLIGRWGSSTQGGVRYYLMDNEWAIWHDTHRDVYPVGVTMDQSRDLFCAYASMVKSNDPQALVLGPEEFGWSGYLYSGYDLQWGNKNGWGGPLPDRTAHGGAVMMPWWLNQVRLRSEAEGRRLLDVFTLHYYPQGGEYSDNITAAMQARRNRSTRSLWDTNYIDETWVNDCIKLIPLMKSWVASNYPGTPIGITEYSWGADNHPNGGTTQADVLGIFGREGLDMATRWVSPPAGSPAFRAFQMYRNVDGQNRGFGDISVRTTVPNPDQVSAFAAEGSDSGELTVIAINKDLASDVESRLVITNFVNGGLARMWRMAGTQAIVRLPDQVFTTNLVTVLPPQSVTLILVPGQPQLHVEALAASGLYDVALRGTPAITYHLESSTNLSSWGHVDTFVETNGEFHAAYAASNTIQYLRAKWLPNHGGVSP